LRFVGYFGSFARTHIPQEILMLRYALALLILSAPALADTNLRCEQDGVAVSVVATQLSAKTTLTVNGAEIPALRGCVGFTNGNPHGGGKWRCPHLDADTGARYEVYPILSPANGEAPYVSVLGWDDGRSLSVELKDCK
jgi:hypothetical protein